MAYIFVILNKGIIIFASRPSNILPTVVVLFLNESVGLVWNETCDF